MLNCNLPIHSHIEDEHISHDWGFLLVGQFYTYKPTHSSNHFASFFGLKYPKQLLNSVQVQGKVATCPWMLLLSDNGNRDGHTLCNI